MDERLNEDQKRKLKKVLSGVTFCSLSTCHEGDPHTTMVQPSVTSELDVIILAKKTRKKIANIKQNNRIWLTFDASGFFKIPKVVYMKGVAKLEPLTQESFDEFLSYHGWITKKILKKLTSEGLHTSTRIIVKPDKIITYGVFGKIEDTVSFIP
ncbi:MAG: pyridoxamine 5'-phosphate oxidase family protein [Candidatus Lokiarchaeota archaeon]|nr:pyridoxamine 5'-phosphate oxidase family protein [Candidatus Lokiarchaeota archaeon]